MATTPGRSPIFQGLVQSCLDLDIVDAAKHDDLSGPLEIAPQALQVPVGWGMVGHTMGVRDLVGNPEPRPGRGFPVPVIVPASGKSLPKSAIAS